MKKKPQTGKKHAKHLINIYPEYIKDSQNPPSKHNNLKMGKRFGQVLNKIYRWKISF